MSATPIRIVCFDAGGVLVRICRSWEEGCKAAGVEFRCSREAGSHDAERARITEAYQCGLISCEDFTHRMAATTAGLYDPAEFRAVHDAWIINEYEGVCALVRALNSTSGVETALLSNTNASHWAHRHMLGSKGASAVGCVKHPHASHLLGLVKPGMEIYRAFVKATGAPPASILFFDDMEENVLAARAAGWRAELIDFRSETVPQIETHLQAHGVRI